MQINIYIVQAGINLNKSIFSQNVYHNQKGWSLEFNHTPLKSWDYNHPVCTGFKLGLKCLK